MKKSQCLFIFILIIAACSCSKKIHPDKTDTAAGKIGDTIAVRKIIIKIKQREPVPKVITVSDSGARKTIDGRYYYDLDGHRYWRNNKDGKYYLFNKSMYSNDDFKPN